MSAEGIPVAGILRNAEEIEPGLWSAREHRADLSYPESGHTNLMSIEDESYWFRHRAKVLIALMEKFPPHGAVFDVGGGNGYMVRAMRAAGYEAVLVEPGEAGSRSALSRGLTPVLWGTTAELGIAKGTLPSLGLFDVVEHLGDDAAFLGQMYGLMARPSRCYLTVPAFQWLWSANDERAGHFRRYRSKAIRHLASQVGLEVEYVSYVFGVLTLPLLLLRSIPHRIGIGAGKAGTTEAHRLPGGVIGALIERSLDRERKRIKAGGRVRWGTSIVVIASKPS